METVRFFVHEVQERQRAVRAAVRGTALIAAAVVWVLVVPAARPAEDQTKEAAPGTISDKDIVTSVESDLFWNPVVRSHLIDVASKDGVVTLSGSVDNLLTRDQAVAVAGSNKGVRAVVDRLEIAPVERSDEEILKDIKGEFAQDPVIERMEIEVEVLNGIVTLTGAVDSHAEKNMASQIVKGIKGVKGVDNRIEVVAGEPRSDKEIMEDVVSRLHYDPRLDSGLMNVAVKDGKVTLSGDAGSATEKAYAFEDAWVAGVTAVVNNLQVKWWATDESLKGPGDYRRSDQELKESIRDAFRFDPRIALQGIQVEVRGGVVTLTGVTDNLTAKRAAAESASNTPGVRKVVDMLKVRPGKVFSDKELEEKVRLALMRNAVVERHEIGVKVRNRRAFLYGSVDSAYEKEQAEKAAAHVEGVVAVDDKLTVR